MASQSKAKAVRALVVEDDYFLATDHAKGLADAGVEVIGPVGTVEEALEVLRRVPEIDWAMLDVNLHGKQAYAVADALIARGVPFAFATGYDAGAIPEYYRDVPRIQKPFNPEQLPDFLPRPANSRGRGRHSE